jgi:GTP-binding protein
MFLDEAQIFVSSGKGGNGVVHFRREKYVPHGGPDGGDGGKGGDVILVVSSNLSTLYKFRNTKRFVGKPGKSGGGSNKTGASGDNVIVEVPPGTMIFDVEKDELIGDLTEPDQRLIICNGGMGGKGNARFATSRNQAPRVAEKGEPGEERTIRLELKLIADVGIVGVPNAGKSTLLAAVTKAKPKIAPYPFTTLQPNLGVAELDVDVQLVLADIPGLIEGAHQGIGLGSTFLRHIQRTHVLIHLVDGTSQDPIADFSQVNAELALFDEKLGTKAQIIAVNKLDLPEVKENWEELREKFERLGYSDLHPISALARTNLTPLLWAAHHAKQEIKVEPVHDQVPVYRVEEDPDDFTIKREVDGAWRVEGLAVERAAAMTYWEYDEAVRRFQRILEYLGVDAALRDAGALPDDTVRIGEYELEWQD